MYRGHIILMLFVGILLVVATPCLADDSPLWNCNIDIDPIFQEEEEAALLQSLVSKHFPLKATRTAAESKISDSRKLMKGTKF